MVYDIYTVTNILGFLTFINYILVFIFMGVLMLVFYIVSSLLVKYNKEGLDVLPSGATIKWPSGGRIPDGWYITPDRDSSGPYVWITKF